MKHLVSGPEPGLDAGRVLRGNLRHELLFEDTGLSRWLWPLHVRFVLDVSVNDTLSAGIWAACLRFNRQARFGGRLLRTRRGT